MRKALWGQVGCARVARVGRATTPDTDPTLILVLLWAVRALVAMGPLAAGGTDAGGSILRMGGHKRAGVALRALAGCAGVQRGAGTPRATVPRGPLAGHGGATEGGCTGRGRASHGRVGCAGGPGVARVDRGLRG